MTYNAGCIKCAQRQDTARDVWTVFALLAVRPVSRSSSLFPLLIGPPTPQSVPLASHVKGGGFAGHPLPTHPPGLPAPHPTANGGIPFLPAPSMPSQTPHTPPQPQARHPVRPRRRPGRSLTEKKNVPLHSFPKKARGHSMCSTIVGGGWRLVVGGDWRLAVGNWRLVAVGGGWRRLVAVGSGWRLVVSRRWRLAAVGSGWRLAVGSGWRLAVGGGWRLVVPWGGP